MPFETNICQGKISRNKKDKEESNKTKLLVERMCILMPYGKMHAMRKNNKRLSSSSFSRVYVHVLFCYSVC